jgi:hypothetical protein
MSPPELRVALLTDAFVTESGHVVDGVANAREFALTRGWKAVFDRLLEDYRDVAASTHRVRLSGAAGRQCCGLSPSSS